MSNQLEKKLTSSFSSLRWLIICRMPHGMRIALRLAQICRSLQIVSVVEITTPITDHQLAVRHIDKSKPCDVISRRQVTGHTNSHAHSSTSTLDGSGRGHSIAIYIERKLDMRHMDVQRSDTNPIVQAV